MNAPVFVFNQKERDEKKRRANSWPIRNDHQKWWKKRGKKGIGFWERMDGENRKKTVLMSSNASEFNWIYYYYLVVAASDRGKISLIDAFNFLSARLPLASPPSSTSSSAQTHIPRTLSLTRNPPADSTSIFQVIFCAFSSWSSPHYLSFSPPLISHHGFSALDCLGQRWCSTSRSPSQRYSVRSPRDKRFFLSLHSPPNIPSDHLNFNLCIKTSPPPLHSFPFKP